MGTRYVGRDDYFGLEKSEKWLPEIQTDFEMTKGVDNVKVYLANKNMNKFSVYETNQFDKNLTMTSSWVNLTSYTEYSEFKISKDYALIYINDIAAPFLCYGEVYDEACEYALKVAEEKGYCFKTSKRIIRNR